MQKLSYERWSARVVALLICIPIVQTLLFYYMPGLNSDAAQWGIAASGIIHGEGFRITGFTSYEGAIRIYLTALSSLFFGFNRLALELPFAAFNSLSILFVYLLMRRLFSANAGIICALVLSFCPWFVIINISAWYYCSASIGLLLITMDRRWASVLAGIVLGLACYEHQFAAVIPLAMLGAWLICDGGRMRDRVFAEAALFSAFECEGLCRAIQCPLAGAFRCAHVPPVLWRDDQWDGNLSEECGVRYVYGSPD
ncbi:MAG: glycosyltransferase family 39 protein [Candidatus Aureabacteria bacterium]|nr:glycosyltransferase family 39 protein [Candidatus Auribacterota bacterium]